MPVITHAGLRAIHVPAVGSSARHLIVLHGYGASMDDLASLADALDPRRQHHWYFLDAPLSVDLGMGMTGRAWAPLDVLSFMRLAAEGRYDLMMEVPRPGLKEAAAQVHKFVEELGIPWHEVILAGFSQGSMTAAQLWLDFDVPIPALILWSTALTNRPVWLERLPQLTSSPQILMSHGRQDEVLPISVAKPLCDLLQQHHKKVNFIPFDGGHEIPAVALKASHSLIFGGSR